MASDVLSDEMGGREQLRCPRRGLNCRDKPRCGELVELIAYWPF